MVCVGAEIQIPYLLNTKQDAYQLDHNGDDVKVEKRVNKN
jgi:hypothetical protein